MPSRVSRSRIIMQLVCPDRPSACLPTSAARGPHPQAVRLRGNVTVLHIVSSVLPKARNARALWNYRMTSCDRPASPPWLRAGWTGSRDRAAQDFLATLNDRERLDPGFCAMRYEHPIYTPETVRAQSRLDSLATDRTVYAGAYHGWGFREDGCRSALRWHGTSVAW